MLARLCNRFYSKNCPWGRFRSCGFGHLGSSIVKLLSNYGFLFLNNPSSFGMCWTWLCVYASRTCIHPIRWIVCSASCSIIIGRLFGEVFGEMFGQVFGQAFTRACWPQNTVYNSTGAEKYSAHVYRDKAHFRKPCISKPFVFTFWLGSLIHRWDIFSVLVGTEIK